MLEFMDLKGITADATNYQNVYCNYHFHYQFELLLVWDGEVNVKISGKEYTLHRGDVAFSLPFEPHSYFTEESSRSICYVFAPEIVSSFYKIINQKKNHKNAFSLDPDLFRYMEKTCVSNQRSIHKTRPSVSETEQMGTIYLLLSQIDRHCPLVEENGDTENTELGDVALKYLSQHFLEPISLESVAGALGYNKSYLSRIVKEQTGKGFANHLISLRIFHAARLIEIAAESGSEVSFSEIAFECGFNNIRSFNRGFKMITDETPSKYWANHRKHTKLQRSSN
ncbi:MAG: helix-turn-helix transcriptional regulator [Clostridia bacterium]|nr:helix-turn-helix transcriptional regulator [Clostridia bacterium]